MKKLKFHPDNLAKHGISEEEVEQCFTPGGAGISVEEVEELTASASYYLLCRDGLCLKLSRKDYELLSRLAARKDIAVETLAKRWVVQCLRQEAKQLVPAIKRSPTVVKQAR